MRRLPTCFFRRFGEQGIVVKRLAGLAADEARMGGVARDQAHASSVRRVILADLCFVADIGLSTGAADKGQAYGQRHEFLELMTQQQEKEKAELERAKKH